MTDAEKISILTEALAFYANPESYHAMVILGDPPCGEFAEDFSADHENSFYRREMPGKRARDALAKLGLVVLSTEEHEALDRLEEKSQADGAEL